MNEIHPVFKGATLLASLYPAYQLFLMSAGLGAVIASVPVMKCIDSLVELPPVASKIVGFAVIGGLLIVSWFVAEAIVVLGAIAIAGEVIDLINKIREAHAKKEDPKLQELKQRFNFGAPQLHIVEER